MEAGRKTDLMKIVDNTTKDLHNRIDQQRHILAAVIEKKIKGLQICPDSILLDCPHKKRLRDVLTDTIEILEDTKKAFKSKRLEMLRKKLIRVLAEND